MSTISSKTFCILAIISLAMLSCQPTSKPDAAEGNGIDKKWWKEAVVYQIYPRSFKDSDGDGIGDLKGIISKLDYIQSLGIDVVWLNPIYASPNADNGYDISNYREIMKDFGTMDDFNTLLEGLHKRHIKLVMDLVVNHSSDEHEWFKQSRSSRTNPYRDYYHWWPAEKGTPPFRPSAFDVDGSGWKFDSLTNAYYLHYFAYKQPDLNWENPKLRQEIYSMMHFWFKKGIDGFRMDVIPYISKDTTFPVITQKDIDEKYGGDWALKARFKQGTNEQLVGFNYDPSSKRVNYHFPEFNTQKIYGFQLVKIPQEQRSNDRNAQTVQSAVAAGGGNVVQVKNKQLSAAVTKDAERELYSSHFRTSKFSTFLEKINGAGTLNTGNEITDSTVLWVVSGNYQNAPETLDEFEMKGNGGQMQPLIQYEVTEDNLWYQNLIYPFIYQLYPVNPAVTLDRDTSIYGLIPKRDLYFQTPGYMNGYRLSQAYIESDNANSKAGQIVYLYSFGLTTFFDFQDLKKKALNVFTGNGGSNIGAQRLIDNTYPGLVGGQNYGFRMKYILPGANQPTHSVTKYLHF